MDEYPIMYRMALNKGSWVADNYKKMEEQADNRGGMGGVYASYGVLRNTRVKTGQDGWGWH